MVIPGHNLGNSQVSVKRTIGPTLVVGMAAILVMGPASCHQIFISLYLKAVIKNLVQIGKAV